MHVGVHTVVSSIVHIYVPSYISVPEMVHRILLLFFSCRSWQSVGSKTTDAKYGVYANAVTGNHIIMFELVIYLY